VARLMGQPISPPGAKAIAAWPARPALRSPKPSSLRRGLAVATFGVAPFAGALPTTEVFFDVAALDFAAATVAGFSGEAWVLTPRRPWPAAPASDPPPPPTSLRFDRSEPRAREGAAATSTLGGTSLLAGAVASRANASAFRSVADAFVASSRSARLDGRRIGENGCARHRRGSRR
jgi:hypothetical protein